MPPRVAGTPAGARGPPRDQSRALVFGVLGLSMIDGAWTIAHLERGGAEANPLLAWAHAAGGIAGFAALKLGLSVVAVVLLAQVLHTWSGRALAPLALAAYVGVLGIHVCTEGLLLLK